MDTERKPRSVRLDDEEWAAFLRNLGSIWLRNQIARSIKRENRKPTAHKIEE